MDREEIVAIVNEELGENSICTESVIKIRTRVMRTIVERLAKSSMSERYRKIFLSTLSADEVLIRFAAPAGVTRIETDVQHGDQLLGFYEDCARMCEFMIDEYDETPETFRKINQKDRLIETAASIHAEKEEMFEDFGREMESELYMVDLKNFQIIISSTRRCVLGDDLYEKFTAETSEALQIIANDERLKGFFYKAEQ